MEEKCKRHVGVVLKQSRSLHDLRRNKDPERCVITEMNFERKGVGRKRVTN